LVLKGDQSLLSITLALAVIIAILQAVRNVLNLSLDCSAD
jgi:hypothetical protein